MGGLNRTVEQKLAAIANEQQGNVTRAQLLSAGVSSREIERRVEKGSLLPEFRGVYRVGHRAPSTESRYFAAVLACGEGAVLSGRAAAHLLGLIRSAPPEPEVTARKQRRIDGVRTRRERRLDPRDTCTFNGIPSTIVPRTLVDLAAVLPFDDLALACHEAGVRYRTTPRQVEAVLERRGSAKGAATLRRVLKGEAHVSLSKLEKRFLGRLREERLQLPAETNRIASARRVDCRWPDLQLTVELDSYRYHGSRHAWEQDRRREREAYGRGDQLRRYTYGDVFEHPGAMLAELRALLTGELGSARC